MTRSPLLPEPSPRPGTFPRIAAVSGGVLFIVLGLWAMVAPRTFFDTIAVFAPYNQHFIQDIGAFQIGLGAVLLLALASPSTALGPALLGVGLSSAAHTISHVVGRNLGGRPSTDIPMLLALTGVLLVAGWRQWGRERA